MQAATPPQQSVNFGATGDGPRAPLGKAELGLWVCGVALFALILVVGYLAYLSPAMLIEFASLRMCG
jgi:hypothetical protein